MPTQYPILTPNGYVIRWVTGTKAQAQAYAENHYSAWRIGTPVKVKKGVSIRLMG